MIVQRNFGIDHAAHRRHARRLGLAMERVPMRDFDVEDQRDKLAWRTASRHLFG